MEKIVVIPDFFEPDEKVELVNTSFTEYFAKKGYGFPVSTTSMKVVDREEAERYPNPRGARIRQLVTNVMVFEIPDVLYGKWGESPPGLADLEETTAILLRDAELFAVRRSNNGVESRLHNKISTAVGGHVDRGDMLSGPIFFSDIMRRAAVREVTEELMSVKPDAFEAIVNHAIVPLGVIHSAKSEVERLHTGFVSVMVVPTSLMTQIREKDKLQQIIIPFSDLMPHNLPAMKRTFDIEWWSELTFAVEPEEYALRIIQSIKRGSAVLRYIDRK